ncbi:MAG: hypothetical protein V9G08_06430 [Dermatophilaceae bacterium]
MSVDLLVRSPREVGSEDFVRALAPSTPACAARRLCPHLFAVAR